MLVNVFGEGLFLAIDVMLGFWKSFTKGSLLFIQTVVCAGGQPPAAAIPPAVTEAPTADAVEFEQSLEWLPVVCGALVAAQPLAAVMYPGGHILGLTQPGTATESAIDVNDGLEAT